LTLTLHVLGSSSAHHQNFFIHCTFGTGVRHTGFEDNFRAGPGWSCSNKINFGKLVHLVGIIKNKFVTIYGQMNVEYDFIPGKEITLVISVMSHDCKCMTHVHTHDCRATDNQKHLKTGKLKVSSHKFLDLV